MRACLAVLLAAGIGALITVHAVQMQVGRAEDLGEPVRVDLKGHPGCPDENGFFAEMRARTTRVRRPNTGEKARTFKVSIKQVGGKSVGELTIPGAAKRSISGDSCGEVVSALAFIAALSIDPNASSTPVASTTISASVTSSTPVISSASVVASVSASASAAPPLPSAKPKTDDARLRWSGGVGVTLVAAQNPSLVLATPVHFEGSYERPSLFSPSARLSFVLIGKGGLNETPVGRAYFRWTYAALDGCPVRWSPVRTITMRPCAGMEGGTLAGGGLLIGLARNETRPWLAARAYGRIDWTFLDTLTVEMQIGGVVPLTRDRFVFDPATLIYQAPIVMPFAGLGLGVRFP